MKSFIRCIIRKDMLLYKTTDLLYEEIFKARQLEESLKSKNNQLPITEKVSIIRISDNLSYELRIIKDINEKKIIPLQNKGILYIH